MDHTFSLSTEAHICFVRPAIDVLFESTADAYREEAIGILLTGSNADGALGMQAIQKQGGLTIVQNPKTAESPYMPESALKRIIPDYILELDAIPALLKMLGQAAPHLRQEIV